MEGLLGEFLEGQAIPSQLPSESHLHLQIFCPFHDSESGHCEAPSTSLYHTGRVETGDANGYVNHIPTSKYEVSDNDFVKLNIAHRHSHTEPLNLLHKTSRAAVITCRSIK